MTTPPEQNPTPLSDDSLYAREAVPAESSSPGPTQSSELSRPETPADEPYQPPVYQAPTFAASGNEPPSYPQPGYESPAHQPQAYEVPPYAPPTYGPPAYAPPAFQPPTYGPAGYDHAANEASSYEPAAYETAGYEPPPAYQPPAYQPPAYGPPAYGPPAYGPPAYAPPAYGPQDPNAQYGPQSYPPSYLVGAPEPATAFPKPRRHIGRWVTLAVVIVLVIAGVVAGAKSKDSSKTGDASANQSVDTGTGGVLFTYAAGHFRARFPSQPESQSLPMTIGGEKAMLHVAALTNPHVAVESEDFTPAMPAAAYETAMQAGLRSIAALGNFTVVSQNDSTFRGKQARVATYTNPDGDQLSGLIFFESPNRLYVMLAETSEIAEIEASFTVLP
ncbi:hypothetical protein SAMN05444157_0763 [Frankineae bacterium MT45]|nr:hypothetical protein SAMN05444157_0763 [Frankineae bacterium MT45]